MQMKKNFPSIDLIRRLFDYDSISGVLTWRVREPWMFTVVGKRSAEHQCKIWNNQHAGTIAGYLRPDGYLKIGIGSGRVYAAHHIAWAHFYGAWPTKNIDHKDGNKALNSIVNMREASYAENSQNRTKLGKSTSGLVGVTPFGKTGKWCARITSGGKTIHLGLFYDKEKAFAAYLGAKARLHLFQPEPRPC